MPALAAQEPIQEPVDVSAAVECFAQQAYGSYMQCTGAYPAGTVEAVLDGLEHLALTSNDEMVRGAAVTSIGMVGHEEFYVGIATLPRLARLYASTEHPAC